MAQGFLTKISSSGPHNRTRTLPVTIRYLQGQSPDTSVMSWVCSNTSPGHAELSATPRLQMGGGLPTRAAPWSLDLSFSIYKMRKMKAKVALSCLTF